MLCVDDDDDQDELALWNGVQSEKHPQTRHNIMWTV